MVQNRIRLVGVVISLSILTVLITLSRIQVQQSPAYRQVAEEKRRSTWTVRPRRGTIYDRNGVVLARDVTRFDVDFIPATAQEGPGGTDAAIDWLARATGTPRAELDRRIADIHEGIDKAYRKEIRWLANRDLLAPDSSRARARQEVRLLERLLRKPYPLVRDLSPDVRDRVHTAQIPGLRITPRPQRVYPHGPLAAHVLGYQGQVTTEETYRRRGIEDFFRAKLEPVVGERKFEQLARSTLFRSASYGMAGVELYYDEQLRGYHGVEVRRGARNGPETVYDIAPTAGADLYLTLDVRLQQAAEDALAKTGKPGAIVALDPRNGEVLALASWPTFNPNDRTSLVGGENAPTLCRAIAGTYPAGSTIKPVGAIAALQELPDFAKMHFDCGHETKIGGTYMHCMGTHNSLEVTEALKRSCNIFFYKTGIALKQAENDLDVWLRKFGVDSPTGIDLPGEKDGTLPEARFLGEVANHAIGQAFTTTPLRMATIFSALANGGLQVTPHLRRDAQTPAPRPIGISADSLAAVRAGLYQAANVRGGTSFRAISRAGLDAFNVHGKTGSAETGRAGEKTHSWYVCFADGPDQQICMAIVVERAGLGGAVAAPIAKGLLQTYFGVE